MIANLHDMILMRYATIQKKEKSSGSLRREGIEKRGSEEPLQSKPLPCFQVKIKYIWSGRERLSHVHDKPCCGYCDLYSRCHDNSELSFLGDASGNISPPYRISELDCELPNRSLLEGEHFPCSCCSGSRKSKQPNRWMTSPLRSP